MGVTYDTGALIAAERNDRACGHFTKRSSTPAQSR
jgi:hypothetical protein